MKELSKIESGILLVGAILMVIGSCAAVLGQLWSPWLFAMGVVMFVLMQFKQSYEGNSLTIRRLRTILIFSDIMFIAAAFLMFANQTNFLGLSQIHYVQYIHNNWVIALLIAAILQLYATHRLGTELKKEKAANGL